MGIYSDVHLGNTCLGTGIWEYAWINLSTPARMRRQSYHPTSKLVGYHFGIRYCIEVAVKEYQSKQDEVTCLLPKDLSEKIITNTGKTTISKPVGNGDTEPDIKIAPGEI